jgi:O-succinylbenzoate synthase
VKIRRVELREIQMSLVAPFETSFERTTVRRMILVRVSDDDGASGWGECTAPEEPLYNHEFVAGAWLVMRDFLIPKIIGKDIASAAELSALFKPIRGHRMAKGGLEAAWWDLEARKAGKPLWQMIGGTKREIECGVSIGIQSSESELLSKIEHELAAGYRRIKLKIKPGIEVAVASAARRRFPDVRLSVDANSAYTLADLETLRRLDEFGLMMIEQPLAHDDLVDHAQLQKQLKTPVCLDESVTSVEDARKALQLGACRIINIKLGRVGGHSEAKRIQSYCLERDVPVWCGGMLESGIGRAHNIAMSTLEGFSLPGDVSASKRYWVRDIIEPEVEVTPQGTIRVPDGPGFGFEVNEKLVERLTVRHEVIEDKRVFTTETRSA